MGERSILIEFEPEISETILNKVLSSRAKIENNSLKVNIEVTTTYNSLLITYPYHIENVYSEISTLENLLRTAKIDRNYGSRIFYFPVCYDAEFGLDLELISEEKNLTLDEIVGLHSEPIYTVYFVGFLPGFLYLGGMDKSLRISRKKEPRPKVEKGAVGIGENQTGIYPKNSPGGWQIIGNSPVPLFDRNKVPPCEISAGDKIKFFPISKLDHAKISEEVAAGNFRLKNELYAD